MAKELAPASMTTVGEPLPEQIMWIRRPPDVDQAAGRRTDINRLRGDKRRCGEPHTQPEP